MHAWVRELWYRMRQMDAGALAKVIVGLGNPGRKYQRSRHNIGFMVLEALAREASGSWSRRMLSRTCRVEIEDVPVLLVEPLVYMNNSGSAVQGILSALERGPQDLLVVSDDFNLPLGRIRIREGGSAGGHRGLESILTLLNTDEILRVRIGVGEESMPDSRAEFVLSDWPAESMPKVDEMIVKAGNAVKSILKDGVSKSMAIFNA